MDCVKSLDFYKEITAAILCDVQMLHSDVYTQSACSKDIEVMSERYAEEGISFLTKTLPRLGKATYAALSGDSLDCSSLGFKTQDESKLPKFLGSLFNSVFSNDGRVLPTPCVTSIKMLSQVLFVFYKLELAYSPAVEQSVVAKFIETDAQLEAYNKRFGEFADALLIQNDLTSYKRFAALVDVPVVRVARRLLWELFSNFDPRDIHPRHGPGAVATREQLAEKYRFRDVSPRLAAYYPLDAYFYASRGHVCDTLMLDDSRQAVENFARVCLVPKDSRGPRLISCEPLDFQWIQQGLGVAIVKHVEQHPLTRYVVHFTNQISNQKGALLGSKYGEYATLDLNEASDRVSIGLVQLLFPGHVVDALMSSRTRCTTLPDGQVIVLKKFAPMGSALCFPVLALTIWALLTAGLGDTVDPQVPISWVNRTNAADEDLLVYGDDVIVKTAKAERAMKLLESFGLKINQDKSCYRGFFRESCGVDAYKGINVTPVKIHTVWRSYRNAESYTSYIAYANELHRRGFYQTYELIAQKIFSVYREVPELSMHVHAPSLVEVPDKYRPKRRRVNMELQKLQWLVFDVKSPSHIFQLNGWDMLLRFFAEQGADVPLDVFDTSEKDSLRSPADAAVREPKAPFSVFEYTERRASKLVRRWR